ncbi:ATP-binding protein [Candidatus Woesearchaeota archaeon]|nr:ATP-binding protein [Candidatus Woesearchaeota archaeon]
MRDVIIEWNPWWGKGYTFLGIKREKLYDLLPWFRRKEIISIVGVRRAGKTTLLFEIIDHLIRNEEVNNNNILFIKADDDRIDSIGLIDKSIDEYEKLINPEGKIFVFIDEIQEIKEWQKTLKRIYDLRGGNIKIFISGSNASLLREELSSLAGRYAYFELFPFTFSEFLQTKGLIIKNKFEFMQERNKIRHFFIEYLTYGAFPEVTLEKDEKIKSELVKFYFDSIFYRDIIKRKGIRNPAKLEKLVKYFLQNISNLANFTKISKILELTTDSVSEYTKALEDAYLIFVVNLFEFSYKKQIINPKKIYCVDLGIRNIVGFKFSEDIGRLYENMVFIHLRRKAKEIFYWANKFECDFIIKDGKKLEAIQVCYDLIKSKNRELSGLLDALQHFKLKEGTILTENYEGEEKIKEKKIKYIPLWKWLLK